MKRDPQDIRANVEQLFDEIAHNHAINIALGIDDEFEQYILTRLYFILYDREDEKEEN